MNITWQTYPSVMKSPFVMLSGPRLTLTPCKFCSYKKKVFINLAYLEQKHQQVSKYDHSKRKSIKLKQKRNYHTKERSNK